MRCKVLKIRKNGGDLVCGQIEIAIEADSVVVKDCQADIANVRIGENGVLNCWIEQIVGPHPFQIPDVDSGRR
jgi:hypothetical protein